MFINGDPVSQLGYLCDGQVAIIKHEAASYVLAE